MGDLEKEEYKEIIRKLRKIKEKNNELLELNSYLVDCINNNIVIDEKGLNKENTDFINKKITDINESINLRLIPKIKEKL